MRKTGTYEILGSTNYFIPNPLPPTHPSLQLTSETLELYQEALKNIEKLNEASRQIPDQKRFIKSYVIKEAMLSSAIEGIHTTLFDIFTHIQDTSSKQNKNTQLVVNYVQALDLAIEMMINKNLPISSRIICAAHQALLSGDNGNNANPGNYRKQAVKVGNLTPAPAQKIADLMSDLEKFINEDTTLPVLIKAGLAHLQFETIHPFLDGNGRIGRLLIILMLIDGKLLHNPVLYVSYYFKKHHFEYYQALDRVRTHGDFEGWIHYYLQAINQTALDAYIRTLNIQNLELRLTVLISSDPQFSRNPSTALATLKSLFAHPITTILQISDDIDKAYNTTQKIVLNFIKLGIISEKVAGEHQKNKRSKHFQFDAYLALLEEEF
ncbi:MAG: Fic family protein [Candidatus Dependentiae bacterium]|nr:Fic family protein [Candidatus Dependentiae bacterium]